MATILTDQQILTLKFISASSLSKQFYFSGGSALAYYYLKHRTSEDLDFFNEKEFDPQDITIVLHSLKHKLGFSTFDYQNSFNRNLYFLKFPKSILKLEFIYYPFAQIEEPLKKDGLIIDSVLDIGVNKLFTISQNPRGRDYYDLYLIVEKYGHQLEKLRKLAKQKFDWHVDPLHLATQLDQVNNFLDDPILMKNVSKNKLTSFFHEEAKKFESQILKK